MKARKIALSKKKITIIKKIKTDSVSLNSLLGKLDQKEWQTSGLIKPWFVKEMVAHIAAWQEACLVAVLEILTNICPQIDYNNKTYDAFNKQAAKLAENLSVNEVVSWFQDSTKRLIALIYSLPDSKLKKGIRIYDCIAGNTWEHYQEHQDSLGSYLKKKKRS